MMRTLRSPSRAVTGARNGPNVPEAPVQVNCPRRVDSAC